MAKETPNIQINDPVDELAKKIDRSFNFIIGAMGVGFISLLFMVAGLVIEAWRFNSAIYKENHAWKIQEQVNHDQQKILKMMERMLETLDTKKVPPRP